MSHEWIRFDAPGDFQLILREDFLAIDGFDEEMLLGYHVDSNLSRRMLFHRGSIESLGDSLAGYHCNHNREPTVYHGTGKVANDLDRFFVTIDRPELPAQRDTWGLADEALEEVAVRERAGPHLADGTGRRDPEHGGPATPSDAARVPFELTYDSGHVLPFIADSLAVSPSDATIGYVGANPVLERMLATVVAQLGFEGPLEVADLDDMSSVEELARDADVLIVDLGIDALGRGRLALARRPTNPRSFRRGSSASSTPSSGSSSSSALVSSVESIRADSCSSTAGPCSGTRTSWRTWTAAIRQLTRAFGVRPSGPFRPTTRQRGLRSCASACSFAGPLGARWVSIAFTFRPVRLLNWPT